MGKHTNYDFPSSRKRAEERMPIDFEMEGGRPESKTSEAIWLIAVILLGTFFLAMITGTLPF